MSSKANDDPRQVLAILNSLGVVGVTAPELKAFMKELKLYRKIKEQENQQWKEETKAKLLKRHQLLEITKTNPQKQSSLQTHVIHKPERKRSKSERSQKRCLEVIIDRKTKHSVNQNKENDIEGTISTLAVSFEKCNTQTLRKKLEKTYVKQKEQVQERPVSAPQTETKGTERPSRTRTKSTSSRQRSKSLQLRSRSKSFIRSPQSRPESKASIQAKKANPSDPVALYNKYKNIWDKLSLPGEQSHAKLRWAVREKMMGSEPYPKPTMQYKRPLKSPTKGKQKID